MRTESFSPVVQQGIASVTVSPGRLFAATIAAMLCTGAVLWMAAPAAAQCQYSVTLIEGPACHPKSLGHAGVVPLSMNSSGMVVGHLIPCVPGGDIAFMWTQETGIELLPLPGGLLSSKATDVSESGIIVGEMDPLDGPFQGFVYQDGELTIIEVPDEHVQPNAVNDAGVVAGTAGHPDQTQPRAFIWAEGKLEHVPTEPGVRAEGHDINGAGHVVGRVGIPVTDAEAFVYAEGKVIGVGKPEQAVASWGFAINDQGEIGVDVFWGFDGFKGMKVDGYIVSAEGEWTLIGTLPGFDIVNVSSLSDVGHAVGRLNASSDLPPQGNNGFLYQNGELFLLEEITDYKGYLEIGTAQKILNDGRIIATASIGTGDTLGAILTPINSPPADITNDCVVDQQDLLFLLDEWHAEDSPADINEDKAVNLIDLLMLLGQWG